MDLMRMRREFPQYATPLARIHFDWNRNMTRSAGNARRNGMIRLSIKIWTAVVNVSDKLENEFINTVRHEVAHVIVGGEHGHNNVWRSVALELGCDGERYHELSVPAALTKRRDQPWPCARCGETIHLGPGQFRMAKYEGSKYVHSRCQTKRIEL